MRRDETRRVRNHPAGEHAASHLVVADEGLHGLDLDRLAPSASGLLLLARGTRGAASGLGYGFTGLACLTGYGTTRTARAVGSATATATAPATSAATAALARRTVGPYRRGTGHRGGGTRGHNGRRNGVADLGFAARRSVGRTCLLSRRRGDRR